MLKFDKLICFSVDSSQKHQCCKSCNESTDHVCISAWVPYLLGLNHIISNVHAKESRACHPINISLYDIASKEFCHQINICLCPSVSKEFVIKSTSFCIVQHKKKIVTIWTSVCILRPKKCWHQINISLMAVLSREFFTSTTSCVLQPQENLYAS